MPFLSACLQFYRVRASSVGWCRGLKAECGAVLETGVAVAGVHTGVVPGAARGGFCSRDSRGCINGGTGPKFCRFQKRGLLPSPCGTYKTEAQYFRPISHGVLTNVRRLRTGVFTVPTKN